MQLKIILYSLKINLYCINAILYIIRLWCYTVYQEVIVLTNTQKIKMTLAFIGKSEAWLAKEIGSTPQAFNQRMKTDKFSTVELEGIAKALGAVYFSAFEFPDGTKI